MIIFHENPTTIRPYQNQGGPDTPNPSGVMPTCMWAAFKWKPISKFCFSFVRTGRHLVYIIDVNEFYEINVQNIDT